jgi:outer membrane receptor for ferrienterochelin and colicin
VSFACLAWTAVGASTRVLLTDVLRALEQQGITVVFSAELIDSDAELEIGDISPGTVDRALRALGLTLVQDGAFWLIAPLEAKPPRPAPPMARLTLRSRAGARLESVTVRSGVESKSVAVDARGRTGVVLPLGAQVEVAARGHWPVRTTLQEAEQLILLEPRIDIETVIVTGTRHHLPAGLTIGSAATFTAEQLETVPALGGDSIRIVNHLPGMSSVGVSASPLVRGGLQDETLIRINGVDLIEPFHLADFQSVFSAIDDRTVDSIDVYTGGFPARYGNRMSGVIELATGTSPRTQGTEVGLSMFSAMANTRGHTTDEATWWLGSARRGNLDLMIDRIDSRSGSPKYWDAYGSVGHRVSDALDVSLGTLLTEDDVVFRDDTEEARSRIDNRYLWLRLDGRHGATTRSSTVLALVDSARRKDEVSPDLGEDTAGFLDYTRDVRRVSLRSDWSLDAGGARVELGGSFEYAEADYDALGFVDRGDMGELLGRPETEVIDIETQVDGPSWGLYLSADLPLTETLSVQPGVRFDANDYDPAGRSQWVSPRFGVEWLPLDGLSIRLAAGRFVQPEAIYEMQVTDGIDRLFPAQRANHYIAVTEWSVGDWTLRADGFYKDYENPKARFENAFNPFVILPELEPDRVEIVPSKARSRGVDVAVQRTFANGWSTSLTLSQLDAEDKVNGLSVPRRWSQRHTARLLTAWQGESTQVAATITWHSGWRTSAPPVFTAEPLLIEQTLNNTTLDDYVALDVRLARSFRFGRAELTVFADLANVLDRDNLAGVDYDVEPLAEGFEFVPDQETLLPFIPSVGFRVSF